MSASNTEAANVGQLLAQLLATSECPVSIREAIGTHLSGLYQQANLLHPEVVRRIYDLVAATPAAPAEAEPAAEAAKENEEVVAEPGAEAVAETTPAEEVMAEAAEAEAAAEAVSVEAEPIAVEEAATEQAATETVKAAAEAVIEEPEADLPSEAEPSAEEFAVVGGLGMNGAAQNPTIEAQI